MKFNEDWYSDDQIKQLITAVYDAEGEGIYLEIGCWEGKSTLAIAKACFPNTLFAVDTWQGNLDEEKVTGNSHPSVEIAKIRDVYACFLENTLYQTNIVPYKMDCFEYLAQLTSPIKFCHLDACHDYFSVKRSLDLLLPKLSVGGILCGDDIWTARAERSDLFGGVERAVMETFNYKAYIQGNFWYFKKEL